MRIDDYGVSSSSYGMSSTSYSVSSNGYGMSANCDRVCVQNQLGLGSEWSAATKQEYI